MHTECANSCSRKEPSLLGKTSKADMLDFSFEKLGDELKVRTPLLHRILRTACLRKKLFRRVIFHGYHQCVWQLLSALKADPQK